MANDIIDINVYETAETVSITVNPNLTTVNINQVTGGGGGGSQDLQSVTDIGATTTNTITANSITTTIDSTINGVRVGRGNIAGNVSGNTAIGNQSLQSVINTTGTQGYNNTAVGNEALKSLTTGSYNTAIGSGAGGQSTSSGSSNILVGFQAGRDVSTGTNNLLIENLDIPPSGTIKIGTQIWATKNLDVTTYTDGTPIPLVQKQFWAGLTTGAYCHIDDNPANDIIYGKLYNGYAVLGIHDNDPNTPNKTLAPAGYHIPTDSEWTTLTDYLGGASVAGGKMKATGISLWNSPNTGATNESGFTALPAGFLQGFNGAFNNKSLTSYFWSSSEFNSNNLLFRSIWYNSDDAFIGNTSKINGYSVRAIKDSNPSITSGSYNIILNPKEKSGVTTGSNNTIIGCFDNTLTAGLTSNVIIGNGTGAIRFQSTDTGLTTVPAQTNTLINGDATGKAVVTKEYLSNSQTGFVPYTGATTDVNLGEFGIQLGNLEFDNTPTTIPTTAGSVYYNDADGTLDLILKGGNVTLQIGQETVIRVVNKTATNVSLLQGNYQAVRITGAQGQRPKVDLAQATNDVLSAETIGLVTETIANNQEGFITTSGLVRGINTTGSLQGETWLDGDILYLSPTVAGGITKVKPIAPNHLIIIGYVISAHITQGTIFVKVDNGYELNELHNVKINGVANNNVLAYTSSTSIWENKTLETALGYTPYNATNPSGYQTSSQVQTIADAKVANTITNGVTTSAPNQDVVFDALALKQDTLQSTVNIKSINGNSILGSGDLTISGTGISSLNGLTGATQTFSITTNTGTGIPAWSSSGTNHQLNIPIAGGATTTGLITGASQQISGSKQFTSNPEIPVPAGNTTSCIVLGSPGGGGATGTLSIGDTTTYPNGQEIQRVKGVTSPIQTQLDGKQPTLTAGNGINITTNTISTVDTSRAAYTMLANNTNASAVPTEQVYKDIAEQTYSLSPAFTVTAPTTIVANTYKWNQVGSLVTVRVNLSYTTAGSFTTVVIPLPTDMPTPLSPTGFTAASDILYYGTGSFTTTTSTAANLARVTFLRRNAANNGYEFVMLYSTAIAARVVTLTLQYFT